MVKRKFLISFNHTGPKGAGFGNFFNEREDDAMPSESDLESMKKKVCQKYGFDTVVILSISEVAV